MIKSIANAIYYAIQTMNCIEPDFCFGILSRVPSA